MNDSNGPQTNENNHYIIYGDVYINGGESFEEMCISAVNKALIALILVLFLYIISFF
jgi:hypothetical protein